MEPLEFYNAVLQALIPSPGRSIFPFSAEEVDEVEENCGTIWIVLKDGRVFSLSVMECEKEEE